MKKPTVFLSHSSHDAEVLRRLQANLQKVTSSTLTLFLSSDGQSIPFGRNWVASIERALDSSALMFSFLSPVSTRSSWINFEAGYAYARGVKVVPVTICGQEMNSLTPPLSLLQGFNLRSHEGMNNLLSVINSTFETSYPLGFQPVDFQNTFASSETKHASVLGDAGSLVTRFSMEILGEHAVFEALSVEIEKHHGGAMRDTHSCAAKGVEIRHYQSEKGPAIEASVSPAMLLTNIPILKSIARSALTNERRLLLHTTGLSGYAQSAWDLTAKLHDSPVTFCGKALVFEGISFEIIVKGFVSYSFEEEPLPAWALAIDTDVLDRPELIGRLLEVLVKAKVLDFPDVPF